MQSSRGVADSRMSPQTTILRPGRVEVAQQFQGGPHRLRAGVVRIVDNRGATDFGNLATHRRRLKVGSAPRRFPRRNAERSDRRQPPPGQAPDDAVPRPATDINVPSTQKLRWPCKHSTLVATMSLSSERPNQTTGICKPAATFRIRESSPGNTAWPSYGSSASSSALASATASSEPKPPRWASPTRVITPIRGRQERRQLADLAWAAGSQLQDRKNRASLRVPAC